MRNLFTPIWLAFYTITFGVSGLKPNFPMKAPEYLKLDLFPIQKELAPSILRAALKRTQSAITSEIVPPKRTRNGKRKPALFSPKTENQGLYLNLMREDDSDIIVAIGPAGTGKTMMACYAAIEALQAGKIQKIVITRPVVSVDEEIGFLPGSVASKMDPWTRPVFDILRETYGNREIETMMEEGILEIVPLGFMRGRTFKNTWIVADEMQNSTPMQMFTLATRIGEGSKMVITGDLEQSDRSGPNGLHEIHNKLVGRGKLDYIKMVKLETEDVQRSRAAKAVLELYNPSPPTPPTPPTPLREEEEESETPSDVEAEWVSVEEDDDEDDNDAAMIPRRFFR